MSDRLTTGVEFLDRPLGGGMPPGSLVAVVAGPTTQSHLLLESAARAHPALYVSTVRPAEELRTHLADAGVEATVVAPDPRDLVVNPDAALSGVPEGGLVVVDSATPLEALGTEDYAAFLDALKRRLREAGAVALLHCVGAADRPAERAYSLERADMVWELHERFRPGGIETYLAVPKFRGGAALSDPVKLELSDGVRVDTSRDL